MHQTSGSHSKGVLAIAGTVSISLLAACQSGPKGQCCDKEDQDNAVAVTMEQLPLAVKATLLANTGGGKIEELEKELKDGKMIFSADALIEGKTYDIEIDEKGTLLSKEIEK